MILFFSLFLAWIGTSEDVAKTPKQAGASADYYVPQALSSYSYVIELKNWRYSNPIQMIKKYYEEKNTPAVIVTADFKDGIRQGGSVVDVGKSYSNQWLMEARKLASSKLSDIDVKSPEKGAEGTLIILRPTGVVTVVVVAITNFSVGAGPVIDHNVYTDLFKGITHMVPKN
jgi:hypothetical protein